LGSRFQDVLPLLSDFAKEIANVLSSMDDVDMANLKSGLSFAGVASGIGLAGTSLVKLGIAARALILSNGRTCHAQYSSPGNSWC
jgi:hypothetical protein